MQESNSTSVPISSPQVAVEQSKQNNFLLMSLSVLLLISVSVAGFFAYQTQQLVAELRIKNEELRNTLETTTELTSEPVATESSEIDATADWKTYIDSNQRYSIKYPSVWRVVSGDFFGTGPKEIGEDVLWAVNTFDVNTNSMDKVIGDLGKQFPDRKQTVNKIKVGDLNATQVITTTPSISDWYSETIIFEDVDKIFSVSNGAITDANLQKMTGVPVGTTFKDFYSSFRLLN